MLPASRRSRPPPSHSGGQRVRNRLRRNSSAAVDRRQPEPAGSTRRYEYPWGRTLGRPLQLRLTTPRCGAHDAAVVYSYAGASANGVTSDPQPPGPEQRRRQALRLRCSSPARRHTGCAGLCALGHTVDDAGGQHGRTRGLRFELHSTVIPFTPAAGVARFAGPTVGRMAANQTRAEQQLIRDEHCLMRNE